MSNLETFKELKKKTLGLDDKFRFGCRMCGKCCTHREDIILSPMDFYRMSKALRIPPIAIYQEYCHTTIGKHSHMPVQLLRSVGEDRHCPLKKDNLCSVHNGKPTSCAIFPLGRYIENDTVKYCLQPVDCGDKKVQTVRGWLQGFNIEAEDKAFLRWHEFIQAIRERMAAFERACDPLLVEIAYKVILLLCFLEYDTDKEFMPQMEANCKLMCELLEDPQKLWQYACTGTCE